MGYIFFLTKNVRSKILHYILIETEQKKSAVLLQHPQKQLISRHRCMLGPLKATGAVCIIYQHGYQKLNMLNCVMLE